jgi:phage protein D
MFIKAGNGTTASGKPLPAITRQDGDQHQFSVADRDAYTGVTAYWQDNKTA